MNKQEFLNVVSKIDTTGEDEFHAQFNSPELLWDNFLIHCFEQLQKHNVSGSCDHKNVIQVRWAFKCSDCGVIFKAGQA